MIRYVDVPELKQGRILRSVCRCNLERIAVSVNHQLSVNRKKFLLCCSFGPYATPQPKTVWEYQNLLKIQKTPQFDSDFQVQLEAGQDLTPFKTIVQLLEQQLPLPSTHVDSQYVGSPGRWCCRISFDWWLIYKVDLKAGTITFEHTGSWNYLFD
ncbi:hypothetical protein ALO50_200096 [Pseudomonas syringae pv. cerasicola]|uniref:Uncharacterized protein n=1 Tax=Pseudomonas syringae pv. cerasicola TaxID=264451 RepID=A0A0P9N998_PSESX|nr:hypothetical protein ALO50_200096 [Pseudomonas syringae pv. cerasicola]